MEIRSRDLRRSTNGLMALQYLLDSSFALLSAGVTTSHAGLDRRIIMREVPAYTLLAKI